MANVDDFAQALELIETSKKAAVTTHVRPDGDACGSLKAICTFIESCEKQAQPFFLSPIRKWHEFLFEDAPVLGRDFDIDDLACGKGRFEGVDLIVICDTNSYTQLPGLAEFLQNTDIPIIVFDHHITNSNIGTVNVIDRGSSSAAEIVYDFVIFAGMKILPGLATALFLGIASDSGWFRFTGGKGDVYRRAGSLIDLGANPRLVYSTIYESLTPGRLKLQKVVIDNIELFCGDRLAISMVSQKDFEQYGCRSNETEGLIDIPRQLASVIVTALFIEMENGTYRCSIRSKRGVKVRILAQELGGGGHDMAAGIRFETDFQTAKNQIVEKVEKLFHDYEQRNSD
ncbi:Bifunctional oligoribonuclease and PAP phosphatase NrnA [Limihaloglobus sulfuriphilus]|uniref:Bifunctional oligoribonuclease and PAP phosphatase NrnA n=1 Tax=Limihaloglobus sulfuriphilus TaxID=1851148 RepID=A0A1Q2MBX5_9BACT|nr:bifunctional oligoribonuclease/PAP phosphatase NrnA [Limihaloglobus sulfuriphilus]AQQ70206.1 Bifunctional oligoribonuclease and PAP phosphatase NrnA [Limihaloglobus sulfuriphilus]